jgi:hypothetical protein
MAIRYLLLLSRQGKVRLAKWFETLASKEKTKIVREVTTLVLGRRAKMCNFLEYKGKLKSITQIPLR